MSRKKRIPKKRTRGATGPPSARSDGPIRTCLGCRERRPQGELLRFVRGGDGGVRVGRTLPGRGYYVCGLENCVLKLERGLKRWFSAVERKQAVETLARAVRAAGPFGNVS
ncbi:MAG: DUF448 domain-containing protein [Candidatus Eisenbacteria bacterium]